MHLNMDETKLPLYLTPPKGYRADEGELEASGPGVTRHVAPLNQRRTAMSYLALIADNDAVQQLLPQVILMNKRTVTLTAYKALARACMGTPVSIWRESTAWATAETLAAWVRWLAKALKPLQKDHWFILSMDACTTHLAVPLARQCARSGVILHILPAGLTHIMQPLDTHVFAGLKAEFRQQLAFQRLSTADGSLPADAIVQCWVSCICEKMTRRGFLHAFASVGLRNGQANLGSRIRRELQLPAAWCPPTAALPTLPQFHALVGRVRVLPLGWWFSLAIKSDQARRGLGEVPEHVDGDDGSIGTARRIHPMRTRSLASLPDEAPAPKRPCRTGSPPAIADAPPRPRPMARRLWGLPRRP